MRSRDVVEFNNKRNVTLVLHCGSITCICGQPINKQSLNCATVVLLFEFIIVYIYVFVKAKPNTPREEVNYLVLINKN